MSVNSYLQTLASSLVLSDTEKSWRFEKFTNRDDLRQEKVAELFYGSVGDNSRQNPSAIKNLCLCSNAQYFWFCLRCRCPKKELNRNLVIQEGAKIPFPSKAVLVSAFFNISLQTVKTNGDAEFYHLSPKCQYVTLKWHFNRIFPKSRHKLSSDGSSPLSMLGLIVRKLRCLLYPAIAVEQTAEE